MTHTFTRKMFADFETWSECELPKTGAAKYAEHPTTEVLLLGYAFDDGPLKLWDATKEEMPDEVFNALEDPQCQLIFQNAAFDSQILNVTLGAGLPEWRFYCTMSEAYTLGLPGSLEQLGLVLGLPEDEAKMPEGKKLVRRFCMPQPQNHKTRRWTAENDSKGWALFCDYGTRDVHAMRECYKRMPKINYRGRELELYWLDQKINNTGLPIDSNLVYRALNLLKKEKENLNKQCQEITNFEVNDTRSRPKALAWLAAQGVEMEGYTKHDVEKALARDDLPANARAFLEIRQQEGRAATSKYEKILSMVCNDGRVRGTLCYYGAARTGRWAGRGLQVQNLFKPEFEDVNTLCDVLLNMPISTIRFFYGDVMGAVASAIRPAIKAPEGMELKISDFSGIEARVLAHLAGEEEALDAFRQADAGTGPGVYEKNAAMIFGVPAESVKKHGDPLQMRQAGKASELGCGFGGGAGAFGTFAIQMGVDLSGVYLTLKGQASNDEFNSAVSNAEWVREKQPEQYAAMGKHGTISAALIKNLWRKGHPKTVKFWNDLEAAAKYVISHKGGKVKVGDYITFGFSHGMMLIQLPSGRFLCYPGAKIDDNGSIVFKGAGQQGMKWGRIHTYGGKICENITQAVARDLMAHALFNLDDAGFEIIGSVHDEAICLSPIGSDELSVFRMTKCMEDVPAWAEGWLIKAETEAMPRYSK